MALKGPELKLSKRDMSRKRINAGNGAGNAREA
jgi:hypothetical protein